MCYTEYVLRKCEHCGLVNANGYLLCPVCKNETVHYKTLYDDDENDEPRVCEEPRCPRYGMPLINGECRESTGQDRRPTSTKTRIETKKGAKA